MVQMLQSFLEGGSKILTGGYMDTNFEAESPNKDKIADSNNCMLTET